MSENDFLPDYTYNSVEKGVVSAQAPSNIALVKYWGKHGEQLPQNASVSFTLSECRTETTLSFEKKTNSDDFSFEVYLNEKREQDFEPKIKKFFDRIQKYVPFLTEYSFQIHTKNTFPHSSGIASSASGMAALSMCLVQMEVALGAALNKSQQLQKASFLARLGSGSASRSIEGPLVVWGAHPEIDGSSDLVGVAYPNALHKNFMEYQDTILLVDVGEKQVSSTAGHDLMHSNPYATERFQEANRNLSRLKAVFESGDLDAFIEIVESEALQLHAMMMSSRPYFILMKPNTLAIINAIWKFRKRTAVPVCFTLDAGANVHVLYPASTKREVQHFIEDQLAQFCKNGSYIH
ncbi:MAG: diphosphomevalonate decarboxylase, partial [Marinirhabdus sp.]|nr:diphosphomevalonate decarboxylase [Marinirhabdus sp.]